MVNIGSVDYDYAFEYGFTGVMARGSGLVSDLRISHSYENYNLCDFSLICGKNGDCYDRFLIRIGEMRESTRIMKQSLIYLTEYKSVKESTSGGYNNKYALATKAFVKYSMEALISHFKSYSVGFNVPKGESYVSIEAPKGELGVFVVSDGTNNPYKCSIKAPGLLHLQGLNFMSKGLFLADLVTIIGTQDIVFGEVDR